MTSSTSLDLSRLSLQFKDLRSHHLPRLTTLKSNSLLPQYESEINQLLESIRSNIQELELEIDDLGSRKERELAAEQVKGLKTDWERARNSTRNALLNARRSIKTAMEQEARSELNLDSNNRTNTSRLAKDRNRGQGDDNIHTASQDVTTALERTLSLLSQELEKSSFSSQLLDESSQSLSSISIEYTSFSSLVKSSTHLIKTMERADFYDKLMVMASFLFFLSCVIWILKRRIWDNGTSVLSFIFGLGGIFRGKNGIRGGKVVEKSGKLLKNLKVDGNGKGLVGSLSSSLTSIIATATSSLEEEVVQTTSSLSDILDEKLKIIDGIGIGLDLGDGGLSRLNTRPTERVEL